MGLLDFLQTPQGQALASGVATYAATARRGTPINNIGRGVLGGITGYGNAVESQQNAAMQAQKDAYNQKQQELLGLHYGNEKYRVETERKRLEQQRQAQIAEAKMFLPGFVKASGMSGQGFDFDEEGNIVPVEMPNAQPVSANVDWMQGADDEYKSMIASAMQSGDPTVRRQAVNEMYRYYRDARKGTKAGGGLSNLQEGEDGRMYGYDKATNTMVPVGGNFKPKEKQPVVKIQGPFNEGEKGFKHELSLRGDFRTEPIYKAYQQVESAYRQIVTSLDKVSPAGDMAAATKIMKLLDPESVVRESELAMALQATGLLDRITSYADRTLKGEKLTPAQRKDFRELAERLFDQAANSYNAKYAEYEKLAGDYGFDAKRAFGNRASKPKVVQPNQPSPVVSNPKVDDLLKKYGGQ